MTNRVADDVTPLRPDPETKPFMSRHKWIVRTNGLLLLGGVLWFLWRSVLPSFFAREALPGDVVGCWALFDAAGRPAERSLYWSPPIVRLDSVPNDAGPGMTFGTVRRLERLDAHRRPIDADTARAGRLPRDRFSYWFAELLAPRLRVRFSSGLSGTTFIFALPLWGAVGDTLRGRAVGHWDFRLLPTRHGRAHAVRVTCEADDPPEPAVSSSADG